MRVCAAPNAGPGLSLSRAAYCVGLAGCLLLSGSIGPQRGTAVAVGDTRTIVLHHVHTNEDLTITYKKNGQYDEDALKKINWVMRDWRKNEATTMDPAEIDLLWEVYQEVGAKEPIYIICGYRSPGTNEMLRHRSRHSGVARFSQHTLGKAIDFYIPGVPLEKLRATAMRLQGGGVGYYPTSGSPFVHLDIGNVRAWPRMSREQLVKLFPNGRTAHIPSDGTPLPGYQLALADLERSHRSAAPAKKRSFLASLFTREKDAEEVDDNTSARDSAAPARIVTGKSAPAATPAAPARTVVASADPAAPAPAATAANVPQPPRRPMYQIASAEIRPAFNPREGQADVASLTATDIINARGLWDSMTAAAPAATNESGAQDMSAARRLLASSMHAAAGRDSASAGPFAVDQDRVPTEIALAYASDKPAMVKLFDRPATVVTTTGSGSVARKPEEGAVTTHRAAVKPADRLDDPWLRGLVLTGSVQGSLVVTRVGDPDFTTLAQFMQKPGSAVMMTFSNDPHLGMSTDHFAGSAVVFPATVTFGPGPRHTAFLQQ